jgi:hypothetical protein
VESVLQRARPALSLRGKHACQLNFELQYTYIAFDPLLSAFFGLARLTARLSPSELSICSCYIASPSLLPFPFPLAAEYSLFSKPVLNLTPAPEA